MLGCNEGMKNKEWLRRRKLRIEQVRKQSSNVAKQLRERTTWKDAQKAEEEKKLQEREFMRWRSKALSDLERKYRSSISEIGMGHKLANAEPDVEQIMSENNKINLNKAKKRGKNAALQEIKERKEASEKKMSPVRRKKLIREIEDIRSNLVCSLPKKQAPIIREELQPISEKMSAQNDYLSESSCSTPRKIFLPIKGQEFREDHIKKVLKKKTPQKKKKKMADQPANVKKLPSSSRSKSSILSRTKGIKSVTSSTHIPHEKAWVNLNAIKTPSLQDSEFKSKSSRSRFKDTAVQPSCENFVEFYNFPSRYFCKSYRECDSLVERIDGQSEQLDAVELARHDEQEQIFEENRKKENADLIVERGNKALAKEKLKREYSDLMLQLEKLSKEERKAKSNHRIPPPLVYMTDERLAEAANRKQKNMDSKFEAIYHGLVEAPKPARKSSEIDSTSDKENISEGSIPQLNVAQSPNLRTTSPAGSGYDVNKRKLENDEKSFADGNSSEEIIKLVRKKIVRRKEKKDLIQNIEKTLEKSRKIRKEATRIAEKSFTSSSDLSSVHDAALKISDKDESMKSKSETEKNHNTLLSSDFSNVINSVKISVKIPEATGKSKQSFLIARNNVTERISPRKESPSKLRSNSSLNKKCFLEDSLPLSASTCYRSPPSELHSERIGHLIDFLTNVNINQESGDINDKLQKNMEKLYNKMSKENREKDSKLLLNPELAYYISKLLGMSREVIANLNVSSVSEISTPYFTDLESTYDVSMFSKTGDEISGGSSQAVIGSDSSHYSSYSGEDKIRAYRLKQAEEIEAKNKEWRSILADKVRGLESSLEQPLRNLNLSTDCKNMKWTKTDDDITFKQSDFGPRHIEMNYSMKLQSPRKENKYEKITMECSQRISELSEKLEQVRKEKEKLLNSSSGNSTLSFKLEKSPKKNKDNGLELSSKNVNVGNLRRNKENDFQFFLKKDTPPALEDFTNRYRLSPAKAHHLSTILEADSQLQICESESSVLTSDSIPNVMDELFQRNILTSPFHWSGEDTLSHISSARNDSLKNTFKKNSSSNIRKDDSLLNQYSSEFVNEKEFRPLYPQAEESDELKFQSFHSIDRHSLDQSEKFQIVNRLDETIDDILLSALDDSSLENMNHILSNLGLKWAKPLFKKNEDLKTLSTSSNSDRKLSPNSCRKLDFETGKRKEKQKNHKKER